MVRSLIPQAFKQALKSRLGVPSMRWSLENLYRCGFRPNVVYDVGAYEGEWSLLTHGIFPRASLLMIEPQESKRPVLEAMARRKPSVYTYVRALCGGQKKPAVRFYLNETVSSVLDEWHGQPRASTEMPLTTLDELSKELPVGPPDLIKLDVQGYELEVLKGAEGLLAATPPEVIVLEVSLIDINRGAPLWNEVDRWLSAKGYRLYDISTLIRRPSDQALWQVDAVYARLSSPLVASKRW